MSRSGWSFCFFIIAAATGIPALVSAHCDTMDGPVVMTARAGIAGRDVTPVLKWVRREDEPEIRAAFARTLAVRTASPEARELADNYFFETLVRVHRAGEGAPYEGLKPSGTDPGPAVTGADGALETGSCDALVKLLTDSVAAGIRERFERAVALKRHANESVDAGREFVEAYIAFTHYVEQIHLDTTQPPSGHAAEGTAHEK